MARTRRRTFGFGPATLVTTSLLFVAWAPLTLAGSSADPEIVDASGDVYPAAYASNDPDNHSLFQNLTAYDIEKAWVGLESQDAFFVFVQVKDLPDGWGIPSNPGQIHPDDAVFGNNVTYNGTSLVANFTVGGAWYEAVFKVLMPQPGVMAVNYELWSQSGAHAEVAGGFDTFRDQVWMMVPKSLIEGLEDGSHLSQFWVLGKYGSFSMDYAPDAKDVRTGSTSPIDVINQLVDGQTSDPGHFIQPQYAPRDYVFGQYFHTPSDGGGGGGGGGAGGGGSMADLEFTIIGDAQQAVKPGGSATYELKLANKAAQADQVTLVLNSADPGWAQQLSASQASLAAGESRSVFLTVTASPDAAGPMRSLVQASSMLGAATSVALFTIMSSITASPDSADHPQGDTSSSPVAATKGSPGLEFVVGAAVLALLVVLRRRA